MNKIVKKVTAIALAGVLTATVLAGCSKSTTQATDETKTYKVGVCQLVQHDALDAATQGFQDALKDILGDAVEIDVQNASNDSATCATITNGFVADGVDLIMANATPALQAAMQSTETIPIVGTSVTDYATALEITDWTGKTGINVTGTSDLAPLADQAAMIQELCPDAKTVGILYCSGEPNSVYQAKVVEEELTALGYETKEFTVADTNDIASVTQNACDNSDVIYIPTDNTMASATGTIDPITSAANIPVITGEEGICKGCGVATLSISYYSIGYKAGEMAADILQNGTDPATMDIEYATDLTKEYIADRATALGITVPDTYTAIEATTDDE
jgi:putative ABC transport system substrate-binding protein